MMKQNLVESNQNNGAHVKDFGPLVVDTTNVFDSVQKSPKQITNKANKVSASTASPKSLSAGQASSSTLSPKSPKSSSSTKTVISKEKSPISPKQK